mgnify:CR=1 FL=1
MSLWSCNLIGKDEATAVESRLKNRFFLPSEHNTVKPLLFYRGGSRERYLMLGCVHCQRAIILYYSDKLPAGARSLLPPVDMARELEVDNRY